MNSGPAGGSPSKPPRIFEAPFSGDFQADRNTVLVVGEVSQIGPRPMLKLLELQARTGMTIKMMGDREQAQAIEAGDTIEILRRALPPEATPELLAYRSSSFSPPLRAEVSRWGMQTAVALRTMKQLFGSQPREVSAAAGPP
jgi:hypothetical protein